jgi:hypothetical protein
MLQIQPDAVKTKMSSLLDKGRDVVPKATHANRFVPTNLGERLAFSHETSVTLISISRAFVNSPGNISGTMIPQVGGLSTDRRVTGDKIPHRVNVAENLSQWTRQTY